MASSPVDAQNANVSACYVLAGMQVPCDLQNMGVVFVPVQSTPAFAQTFQPAAEDVYMSQPQFPPDARPGPTMSQVQRQLPATVGRECRSECSGRRQVCVQRGRCLGSGRARRERRQQPRRQQVTANLQASAPEEAALAACIDAELKAGGAAHLSKAVAVLRDPKVVQCLSFTAAGCRTVQLALDLVDRRTGAELMQGLRGRVAEAVQSPCANYVIQKMIQVLTPRDASFVVEEIAQAGWELAAHEYGCRIYCRLLEHAASEERTACLVDEVLAHAEELATHAFGHHVLECALEHGLPRHKQRILATLQWSMGSFLQNRNATYVVVKALEVANEQESRALAQSIVAQPSELLATMATSHLGSMVARALLQQPGEESQKLVEHLSLPTSRAQLSTTRYGRRLCNEVGVGLIDTRA